MNNQHSGHQVRVGIIGPGWWADTMFMPALAAHPDAVVTAVYGRNHDRARDFARSHDIQNIFSDVGELCASGTVDAVIVATANATHHPFTMTALDAGLHVLCEKPLALTVSEAEEMAAAARAAGLVCHVPFTYRFMPVSQYLRRLVDDGYIGRPYLANLRYYTGYARGSEYLWRYDRAEAGAGVLGDLGSHWIDQARWLVGEVEAVTCVMGYHVERDPRPDGQPYDPGDDSATIVLEHLDGARSTIVVSSVCHEDSSFGQSHHIDLHGSDGTLYAVNDWNDVQAVRGARSGEEAIHDLPIPDHIWGDVRRSPAHDTYKDVFRSTDVMARGWVSAIRDGTTHEPDFDTGAAVQRIQAACELSGREHRRVPVAEVT